MLRRNSVTLGFLIGVALHACAAAADPAPKLDVETEWPQFRGPRGDGTWVSPNLPDAWPADGLKTVWKQPIGGGDAGVSVAGGRVITMDRQTAPEQERILCFASATGEKLWQYSYPVSYGKLDYGNGPRAAPTIVGDRVYTVGALGDLCCLDARSGNRIWQRNYLTDFGGRLPTWGFAGAPVVFSDWLILQPGGEKNSSIIAVDRHTGQEIWRSLNDEAGYCTPLLIRNQDLDQVVCWTPSHIRFLEAKTGRLLWSHPYEITYGVSIAKPIFHENTVFVAGYWHGAKAIRLGPAPEAATLAWEDNRYLRGLMSQPLYRNGHVFLLDKQYGLTCFELKTGKKLWDDNHQMTPRGRNPQASLVWLGDTDRAIILNEEGDLILARLTPQGYREQSRTRIIGFTWAHPAFAGHRVFARSDSELVCVSLTEESDGHGRAESP
jgi:outer membrane protein assembly factor BamB